MPRTLPAGVDTASAQGGYRAFLAVNLATATPILVTDCPHGATIGADTYLPSYLTISETTYDDQPAVSISLDNSTNQVTAQDLDGTALGGLIGKAITLYEVTFDSTGAQLGEVTLYSGIVAAMQADQMSVDLTCTLAELVSAGQVGIITTRLCPYRYGGSRCADADGTSCDHTLAGCTAHANTARFGGFLTMPTLNTKLKYYLTEYVSGTTRFGTITPTTDPIPPDPVTISPRPNPKQGPRGGGGTTPGTGPHKGIEPPNPIS